MFAILNFQKINVTKWSWQTLLMKTKKINTGKEKNDVV